MKNLATFKNDVCLIAGSGSFAYQAASFLKVNRLNKVKNVYKFEGKCLVDDVIHAQCIFSAMIHDIPSTPK